MISTEDTVPIPVLDMNEYHADPHSFALQLGTALHNTGFLLLQHRIDAEIPSSILRETRQFFQRPLTEKMQISYHRSPAFRGYMPLGVETTAGQVDAREQIEYAVEQAHSTDKKFPYYERLRGTNPWPDCVQPSLRPAVLEYVDKVTAICDCLRQSMCRALGLDPSSLDDLFGSNEEPAHWVVKLVSYPAAAATTMGVGPHTDTNFLTLVLQDDVGGLQIFHQNSWMDLTSVVPTTNSDDTSSRSHEYLVVNIGELAHVWSRGYFRATPHRVVVRGPDNEATSKRTTQSDRISVPLFYNPVLSAVIEPIPAIPGDLQQELEDNTWQGEQHNAMLASVGENTFKSLARSHPFVFQKHHGDLRVLADGRIVPRIQR